LTSVRVTPKADDDILSIASFIAHDSVPRALQFIDNMRDGCAKLAIFPKRAAPTRIRSTCPVVSGSAGRGFLQRRIG
jgi:plasmid stabilization system protein ParE